MNIYLEDIDYLDEDDDLCKCLHPDKRYVNEHCWTCKKCYKFGCDVSEKVEVE